jgi:putative ABC transport system permease protein
VTIAAGIAPGLALSAILLRLARSLLFGLAPYDPATTIAASGLTVLAAVIAAVVPAWRAARVDPLQAMPAE